MRPLDGDADGFFRCDIGAYEAEGAATDVCPTTDGAVPLAGCDEYTFDATLDVDILVAPSIAGPPPPCTANGTLGTDRDAIDDYDLDTREDIYVEITFLSGFITCPGGFYDGSSIPNDGYIEENANVQNNQLDLPATGTFSLCVVADTYPYGVVRNCPDSGPAKDPLEFSCDVIQLDEFDCTVTNVSTFYSLAGPTPVAVADVDGGDIGLILHSNLGGVAELPGGQGAVAAGVSDSGGPSPYLIVALAAVALASLVAGAWYLRRRAG